MWIAGGFVVAFILLFAGCMASVSPDTNASSSESSSVPVSAASEGVNPSSIPCTGWLEVDAKTKIKIAATLLHGARHQRGVTNEAAYALDGEYAVEITDGCSKSPSEEVLMIAAGVLLADPDPWMS